MVDNAAQEAFCAKAQCEGSKAAAYRRAWHELFIEADPQRQAALNAWPGLRALLTQPEGLVILDP